MNNRTTTVIPDSQLEDSQSYNSKGTGSGKMKKNKPSPPSPVEVPFWLPVLAYVTPSLTKEPRSGWEQMIGDTVEYTYREKCFRNFLPFKTVRMLMGSSKISFLSCRMVLTETLNPIFSRSPRA